jgi:hypothetical protein
VQKIEEKSPPSPDKVRGYGGGRKQAEDIRKEALAPPGKGRDTVRRRRQGEKQ